MLARQGIMPSAHQADEDGPAMTSLGAWTDVGETSRTRRTPSHATPVRGSEDGDAVCPKSSGATLIHSRVESRPGVARLSGSPESKDRRGRYEGYD